MKIIYGAKTLSYYNHYIMIGGFEPELTFLNGEVPLWFALLMAFTSPHLWSRYVKRVVSELWSSGDQNS